MPALKWMELQPIDSSQEYVAMASRLPLRHYRSIPGFLRDTLDIRRQLAHTPGLMGYTLDAELLRKVFWTFSVWEDRPSLESFAVSDPHRNITRRLAQSMGETRFEILTVPGSQLPLPWDQMKAPVK
jgi:hypothetical protein